MNKSAIATGVAVAALGLAASLPVQAGVVGFNGPFAPGQFTVVNSGTLLPDATLGTATVSSTQLTITGSDTTVDPATGPGCVGAPVAGRGPCEITITTNTLVNPISFHFVYHTNDSAGAGFDEFGYLSGGVHVPLSDPGGLFPDQSGDVVIIGAVGPFGFYINCTDCTSGAATATITQFAAPEPASLALLGLGLALLGMRRKVHP